MLILDRIKTARQWELRIQLFHRGHLSLYPGTTIYLAPVVRRVPKRARGQIVPHFVELIGTTIQERAWTKVFRVSVSLHDGPGVLHEVLASIGRHGGNVLHLDSSSIEQEELHQVEMVVDYAGLFAELRHGDDRPLDRSAVIEGLLVGDCHRRIAHRAGDGFRVRARPIGSLDRAARMLDTIRSVDHGAVEVQVGAHGVLALPERLQDYLGGDIPGIPRIRPPFRYFVTSDTKDRVFRAFILPKNEVIVWCAVRHRDKQGALSSVTSAIKGRGINILTALNRVQRHQGVNWFEMILTKPSWSRASPAAGRAASAKREINKALHGPALKSFGLEPFFVPKKANAAIKGAAAASHPAAPYDVRSQVSLEDWLKEKDQEFERLTELPPPRHIGSDQHQAGARRYAAALKDATTRVRQGAGIVAPKLFLSLHADPTNLALAELVHQHCDSQDMHYDTVQYPRSKSAIPQEVVARIAEASYFMAIWTPVRRRPASARPAPWVLFEIAVAFALRKPFVVLVQKGVDVQDYLALYQPFWYAEFTTPRTFAATLPNAFAQLERMCEPPYVTLPA